MPNMMEQPPAGLRFLAAVEPFVLAALDARCFARPWPAGEFAALLENSRVVAWALTGGQEPASALAMVCFQEAAGEAEVLRIAVHPHWRRKGLAAWLLDALARHGRRLGWEAIHLEVREGNREARALYERAGYDLVGRRRNYYRDPDEDAVRYALRLGEAGMHPPGAAARP